MEPSFIAKRIHSLTGIVPIGLFLVYHLYTQLYLSSGAEAYNNKVNSFYDSPLAFWLLAIFVYIPLIFHSIYGVKLCFEAKVQPTYQYFGHLLYWLQRASGIGVFLFILAHLWNAKVAPILADEWGTHYEHLHEGFNDPQTGLITLSVYTLGILGACFHFANGINTFCMTWGIATTPKSQSRVMKFSIALFIILASMGFYGIASLLMQ